MSTQAFDPLDHCKIMNTTIVKCPTCQVPFLLLAITLPGYIDNLDSEIENAMARINAARAEHHTSDPSQLLNNTVSGNYVPLNANVNAFINYGTENAQHVLATSNANDFEENRHIATGTVNIQGSARRNPGNPEGGYDYKFSEDFGRVHLYIYENLAITSRPFQELNVNDPNRYHNSAPSYAHMPTGYIHTAPSSASSAYATDGYHEPASTDEQTHLPNDHWQT